MAASWIERLNRVPGRIPLMIGTDGPALASAFANVLHWAYSPALPDNVPHRHTYFEVCLVGTRGRGEYRVGEKGYPLAPGALFVARPGVRHQIVNTETPWMELFWVSFLLEGAENPAALREFTDAEGVLVAPDAGARLMTLWSALRVAAEAAPLGGDGSLVLLMASLLSGIVDIARPTLRVEGQNDSAGISVVSNEAMRRALAFVHERLESRTLSVPEIAAAVHLSPRQITRHFLDAVGIPPAAYVEQARLDRARALLLRTDDPIKQIALLVGYGDVHHFTRAFTRRFGCPPGRFRQTLGAANRVPQGADIPTSGMLV